MLGLIEPDFFFPLGLCFVGAGISIPNVGEEGHVVAIILSVIGARARRQCRAP